MYYEKSFILLKTYNSGLNYGFMLLVMSTIDNVDDNLKYYLWAKHVYLKTKKICLNKYEIDDYWVNASLAECCLVLDEKEDYYKYLDLSNLCCFHNSNEKKWKKEKTHKQLKTIKALLEKINFY